MVSYRYNIPVSLPGWGPLACVFVGVPKSNEPKYYLKVTGKRFAHATGPLVNNVLRTISSGSPGQIFSRQVLGWTAQ